MKFKPSAIASSLVITSYAISQVLRLSSNLIMTRLLVPEMFGIMAVCQTIIFMLAMVSDIGITPSIIRSRRGGDPYFLNTAWTLQIIRGGGIGLFVVIVAFSLFVAQQNSLLNDETVYNKPVLIEAMLWIALVPFISGFKSTNIILANRKLHVGHISAMELLSQIIGLVVMISWATISPSIYALLAGALTSAVSTTILSHTLIKGERNRLAFDASATREIISFGKWILITSFLTALLNQGDRLIFGALVDAETLGIYSVAIFLTTAITQAIFKVNKMVFFPLLSETARGDSSKLAAQYYNIRLKTDFIMFTASGFLFALGKTIVGLLYDERYKLAGELLEVLSLSLLLTSPVISGAIYLAIGKPKFITAMVTFEGAARLTLIPILFFSGGINLAIWAVAASAMFIIPLDWYFKHKLKILNFKLELRLPPLFFVSYYFFDYIEHYILKLLN